MTGRPEGGSVLGEHLAWMSKYYHNPNGNWTYSKLQKELESKYGIKVSIGAISKAIRKYDLSPAGDKSLHDSYVKVRETKKMAVLERAQKTLDQVDVLMDFVGKELEEVQSGAKDLKWGSLDKLINAQTKILELRAKINQEIQSGGKVIINLGGGSSDDKLFLEFVRQKFLKLGVNWKEDVIDEFAVWKRGKLDVQMTGHDEGVVDVQFSEDEGDDDDDD